MSWHLLSMSVDLNIILMTNCYCAVFVSFLTIGSIMCFIIHSIFSRSCSQQLFATQKLMSFFHCLCSKLSHCFTTSLFSQAQINNIVLRKLNSINCTNTLLDLSKKFFLYVKTTLGYLLRGQTRQEIIASFFVIVVARGQIVARGQVFMMGHQYNTIDFHV